jgi:hypothetical protein
MNELSNNIHTHTAFETIPFVRVWKNAQKLHSERDFPWPADGLLGTMSSHNTCGHTSNMIALKAICEHWGPNQTNHIHTHTHKHTHTHTDALQRSVAASNDVQGHRHTNSWARVNSSYYKFTASYYKITTTTSPYNLITSLRQFTTNLLQVRRM